MPVPPFATDTCPDKLATGSVMLEYVPAETLVGTTEFNERLEAMTDDPRLPAAMFAAGTATPDICARQSSLRVHLKAAGSWA